MRRQTVQVFVDGSFDAKRNAAGAGVFFAAGDCRNAFVFVPRPPVEADFLYDALRAELYAALVAVHILCAQYPIHPKTTNILIKQDSRVAIALLRHCLYPHLPVPPSTWAADWTNWNWRISFPWGDTITAATILAYADILDGWWMYTHDASVSLSWVKGHVAVANAKNPDDAHGNNFADWHAKVGAQCDEQSACGFPLGPEV